MIAIIAVAASPLARAVLFDGFVGPLPGRSLTTYRQSGSGEVVATVDEGLTYRSDPGTDGYAVLDYTLSGVDLSDARAIEVGLACDRPMALSLRLSDERGYGLWFDVVDGPVSIPLSSLMGLVPTKPTGLRLVFDPPDGAAFRVSSVAAVPEPASLAVLGVGVLGLARRRRL